MNLNQTPSGNRVHIGFFGKRNAGKSSVVNAVTGQSLAVVSDVKGTTTDPVYKAMELLPIGPVVIIDTPGMDDEGALGALRVEKAKEALHKTDIAVLVVDASKGLSKDDKALIQSFQELEIPYILAMNKADLLEEVPAPKKHALYLSALKNEGITELKEKIATLYKDPYAEKRIVGDLLSPGDLVVLVTPIDEAAPKGRLILPQQQTLRDVLDSHAMAVVTQTEELSETLSKLSQKPRVVITDSQAFGDVAAVTPEDVPLTSFSILFARYKGQLDTAASGAKALESLKDGDKVLISEGCTHHRQCNDIGTVKLPGWIRQHTGKALQFEFTSGAEFPKDLSPYRLIVHCGGCMLNEREMRYRKREAQKQGVPFTNYGILIAYMKGILARSMELFQGSGE